MLLQSAALHNRQSKLVACGSLPFKEFFYTYIAGKKDWDLVLKN